MGRVQELLAVRAETLALGAHRLPMRQHRLERHPTVDLSEAEVDGRRAREAVAAERLGESKALVSITWAVERVRMKNSRLSRALIRARAARGAG
jgi:hypothetical protein